ncbi:MAG TPA: heparin lyase I family protein [Fimbriimonadaceae bacterium]
MLAILFASKSEGKGPYLSPHPLPSQGAGEGDLIPNLSPITRQQPHVKLDFKKEANIDSSNWRLTVGGHHFDCVTKGQPAVVPTIVDDEEVGKAIRIELQPTSGAGSDNGRDKINYTVIKGNNPNAPTFDGKLSELSFAVKLDKDFQTPTTGRDYVVAQWWQGSPFGPPLSLQILRGEKPTDTPKFAFVVRNMETGGNPSAHVIEIKPTGSDALERGKWYRFKVRAVFGFKEDGRISVSVNDTETVNWVGSIGYDPSAPATNIGFKTGKTDRHPNQGIEIYFGPYRDRMASSQVFYFADISYSRHN